MSEPCRVITEEQYRDYLRLKKKLDIAVEALREIERKSDKFNDEMGVLDQLDLLKAISQEALYRIEDIKNE